MFEFRQSIYCYPGTNVLINNLAILDQRELMAAERRISGARGLQLLEDPIEGKFDFAHLQAIHKHLFQDLYPWAGQIRNEDIAKGGSIFCYSSNIQSSADRLFSWLEGQNFLKGLSLPHFSDKLGFFAADLNAVHPFREGNGRSTREFFRCLAQEAGYVLDYSLMDHEALVEAFVKSFSGNHSDLTEVFRLNIGDSIIKSYVKEFPAIIEASDRLLENLNKVRLLSPDKEFMPVKALNVLYKELGGHVESGFLAQDDPTFGVVSDTVYQLRTLQAQSPKMEQESMEREGLKVAFQKAMENLEL